MEVHISFWLQVCTGIYLICGKKLKAEYQFLFWYFRSRWTQQPWWDLILSVSKVEASAIQRWGTLRLLNLIPILWRSFTKTARPTHRTQSANSIFCHGSAKTSTSSLSMTIQVVSWVLQLLPPSLQVKRSAQTSTFKSDFWLWRHERTNFESTIKFRWMKDITWFSNNSETGKKWNAPNRTRTPQGNQYTKR